MRPHAAWKVITQRRLACSPIRSSSRVRISAADLFVNVIARISFGFTPIALMRWATRYVSTRVLPEPAPAITSSGPSVVSTASRWASLRSARYWSGVATAIASMLAAALPGACLPHPELVEQDAETRRAVLVVAGAGRQDVDDPRVHERHPRSLENGLPVHALPDAARGIGVGGLLGDSPADLTVDRPIAELGVVRVVGRSRQERRTRQDRLEEPGRSRIVRDPLAHAGLRPVPGIADVAEVPFARGALLQRGPVPERRQELHGERADSRQVRPRPHRDLHASGPGAGDELPGLREIAGRPRAGRRRRRRIRAVAPVPG